VSQYAFCPGSFNVSLEGTDTWRTAYWEITDMKFAGVNQGPQAAARFWLGDKIYFTRVRYAVIRPCGPQAGVNLLEECKPPVPSLAIRTSGKDSVEVYWSVKLEGWTLEESSDVTDPNSWSAVATQPVVENDQNVVKLSVGTGARFFRLIQ